jgi:hypothetical protein
MFVRTILSIACFLTLCFAWTSRAHADPPRRNLLWNAVPPAPDKAKPKGIVASVERFLETFRGSIVMRSKGGEALGRDMSTSLGIVKAPRMSGFGASLAAVGTAGGGVWLLANTGEGKLPFNFGPRFFPGGGGIGFSMKW